MNNNKILQKLLAKVETHSLLTTVRFNCQTLQPESYALAVARTFNNNYHSAKHFAALFGVKLDTAYSYDKDTNEEAYYFIVPTYTLHSNANNTFKLMNDLLYNGGDSLREFASIEYQAINPAK